MRHIRVISAILTEMSLSWTLRGLLQIIFGFESMNRIQPQLVGGYHDQLVTTVYTQSLSV